MIAALHVEVGYTPGTLDAHASYAFTIVWPGTSPMPGDELSLRILRLVKESLEIETYEAYVVGAKIVRAANARYQLVVDGRTPIVFGNHMSSPLGILFSAAGAQALGSTSEVVCGMLRFVYAGEQHMDYLPALQAVLGRSPLA